MTRLLAAMGRAKVPRQTFTKLQTRVLVPYDENGQRTDGSRMMWWDLSEGQRIRISPGHNIQGARQPAFLHIGAKHPITRGSVKVMPAEGYGVVLKREDASCSLKLVIENANMRIGLWWLDAAQRGAVASIPIVNSKPEFALDLKNTKKA